MEKKVSVIVPVYNGENSLADCMASILSQSLREMEVILVDDGSVDRTPALCRNYAERDGRVRVLRQKNAGLGMARNAGLKAAEGEYVAFVDADDWVNSQMCEEMYQAGKEQQADLVLAGICQMGGNLFAGEENRAVCCFEQQEIFWGKEGRERLAFGIVGAEPWEQEDSRYNFSVCKNLYRREVIQDYGLRFPSERQIICEDVIFLLKFVSKTEKAVGIPGAFYCYRRNESSLTRSYRSDMFERFLDAARVIEEEAGKMLQEDDRQRCMDRLLQARARVALVNEVQHVLRNGEGYRKAQKKMRQISGNQKLQEVLRRYPYWKLPGKQAAFAFAMRYRLILLEYFLICLKERR